MHAELHSTGGRYRGTARRGIKKGDEGTADGKGEGEGLDQRDCGYVPMRKERKRGETDQEAEVHSRALEGR